MTDQDFASTELDFGEAVRAMKKGHKVRRKGWNGKNMWIRITNPPENARYVPGCMTLPYISMFTAQGDLVPWLASQADMLGEDWEADIITITKKNA